MLKPSGCPGFRRDRAVPPKPWACAGKHGGGSASASSLTRTSRLRQTVERKLRQLSRIARSDVVWPVEPVVPNPVRQVRPTDKDTM